MHHIQKNNISSLLKFALTLIVFNSCNTKSITNNYSVDFNCQKIFWAEDAEGLVVDFEIELISNFDVNLQDNEKDIYNTKPKASDKGFILRNLCSDNEIRLFDFNDSKLILTSQGKTTFHLCSILKNNNLIDSIKTQKGWYIDYRGDMLLKSRKDTLSKFKFRTRNIKIMFNDLKIEKVSTEKIIMGLNQKSQMDDIDFHARAYNNSN